MAFRHRCFANACTRTVSGGDFMCAKHLRMVPPDLLQKLKRAYRPGQERGYVEPSDAWRRLARAAVTTVGQREAKIGAAQGTQTSLF